MEDAMGESENQPESALTGHGNADPSSAKHRQRRADQGALPPVTFKDIIVGRRGGPDAFMFRRKADRRRQPRFGLEAVERRAYELFQARGCDHGCDLEDWFRAEREILGKGPRDAGGRS
jgi:hypothetical protein